MQPTRYPAKLCPWRWTRTTALLLLTGLVAAAVSAAEVSIPAVTIERVTGGLRQPVHITHAGDRSGRLFIVEQPGVIRILQGRRLLPQPFLDIRDRVSAGGEMGLLSVAFHPQYRQNGRLFVNYTRRIGLGRYTIVAEYRRHGHNQADKRSERVLMRIKQPYSNHNGGQLAFGPDGYLYIGMGDGGAANDPHGHGQNRATLLGALLRIDINRGSRNRRYAIPRDNPYRRHAGHRPEIWAYGLRNPWRFSFDSATGQLYLADVGQDAEEEINIIRKGGNYGWNIMEGKRCTPDVNADCRQTGLLRPIHSYTHDIGRSITGGFVYRGRAIPALVGTYLYADYVSGRLMGLRYTGHRLLAHKQLGHYPNIHISSFGESEARELYIADHRGGVIYRLVAPKPMRR